MAEADAALAASRIEALFGPPRAWSGAGRAASVWETPGYHLLWAEGGGDAAALRRLWDAYRGRRHYNAVLLAPSAEARRVLVAGPSEPLPLRDLPAGPVLRLLEAARGLGPNEAARLLAREFARAADAAAPGVHARDLLTPHFVAQRLLPHYGGDLAAAIGGVADAGRVEWRALFGGLGYAIEERPHGWLLRAGEEPVAVVRPFGDPERFGRLDERGVLPAGELIAACGRENVRWGVLAAAGRYRLFRRDPAAGAATARWIEADTDQLEDRRYLGLFAPAALREGGWLDGWIADSRRWGERLRAGLEERLARVALPALARGLGAHLEARGWDLGDRERLREIEEAALTLVFRFMFLLHTESRGYLPVRSEAYRPHGAAQLAGDARGLGGAADPRSTRLQDRLRTLTRMIRHGDRAVGVPAYNGSLFAADGFPGAALLEDAAIADDRLAPALAAVAFEDDRPDAPGIDFADLDVGHLGAVYEALLGLRLARAPEDLLYDPKRDVYRPPRAGEEANLSRAELYWQGEAGGRKAGGVFYTRREFVRHLLRHSLVPALEEHLDRVARTAERDPAAAARDLFDFTVIDPAMGSAHFLTEALDATADRMARFLADVPGGLPAVRELLGELREAGAGDGAADDGDLLRRLVLKRCIHGVDLSPMAVEVANVTLWLASFVPGLALSWLGSNLKRGDALIGVADPAVVGASDSPLLTGQPVREAMARAAALQRELAAVPDRTPEEVRRSEELAAGLREATSGLRDAFDLWAAAPLGLGGARADLELHADAIAAGRAEGATAERIAEARRVADSFRFFHWPLEFPHVFDRDRPGFDVVVGNPPWEEVTVEELAFYALRDPGLRGIVDLREQQARIAELDIADSDLRREYDTKKDELNLKRRFFGVDGGYKFQGTGDPDLYKLFCERYTHLTSTGGRLGVVLPNAMFVNDGSRRLRQWLFEDSTVERLDVLRNAKQWAFPIHAQFSIALLAAQTGVKPPTGYVLNTTGPSTSVADFERRVDTPVAIPSTLLSSRWEVPSLQSNEHAGILDKVRAGVPFMDITGAENFQIGRGGARSSRLFPVSEVHETNERRLFRHASGVGVWKGRSFHAYDPHGRDPAGYADWEKEFLPWANERRRRSRTLSTIYTTDELDDPSTHPANQARIAYRDVTNAIDYDTVIACLVPPKTPLTNSAPYIVFSGFTPLRQAAVLGVLNSTPFDWQARRYVKLHLSFYILNMLCFPRWEDADWRRIGGLAARLSCADGRFEAFAEEAGVECGPLGEEEREAMRAEIDALTARGYGLGADELRFVFGDFTEQAATPRYRERVMAAFEGLA